MLSRDTWLYNSSPLNTCWGCFPAFPPQRILHFQSQNVAPVFITHLVAVARQKKQIPLPVALCLRRRCSIVKGCCKKCVSLSAFFRAQIVCHVFCFPISFIVVVMVSPRHESLNQAKPYLARFKCNTWGCLMEVKNIIFTSGKR